jgi:hypothetical protein
MRSGRAALLGVARLLLDEVDVVQHAGELDDALELHLSPAPARFGATQGFDEVAGLELQLLLRAEERLHLLGERAVGLQARRLDPPHLGVDLAERQLDRLDYRRNRLLALLEVPLGFALQTLEVLLGERQELLVVPRQGVRREILEGISEAAFSVSKADPFIVRGDLRPQSRALRLEPTPAATRHAAQLDDLLSVPQPLIDPCSRRRRLGLGERHRLRDAPQLHADDEKQPTTGSSAGNDLGRIGHQGSSSRSRGADNEPRSLPVFRIRLRLPGRLLVVGKGALVGRRRALGSSSSRTTPLASCGSLPSRQAAGRRSISTSGGMPWFSTSHLPSRP